MTYQQAIDWLYELRLLGSRLGLENPRQLAELAGNPQDRLKIIHVAGTNGKGSVCAMLECIYRVQGYKTGLFTSPHLVSFRERIQVNREWVSKEDIIQQVGVMQMRLQQFPEDQTPTFFEVITVMALEYFAQCDCDVVLLETGLGGRLDATNIVNPIGSVITPISLDHQQYLGETIEEIAGEKAGIIKLGIPVYCANQQASVIEVIEQVAKDHDAPCELVADGETNTALSGRHQRENATLAKMVAEEAGVTVSSVSIVQGLQEVQWQGRLECVEKGSQKFIIDAAHNPAGAQALAGYLKEEFPDQRPSLLIGVLADKSWKNTVELLSPLVSSIICVPVGSGRGLVPGELATFAHLHCESVQSCDSLTEGLEKLTEESLVVVAGSVYLIGEVMEQLGLVESAQEQALNDWKI
ncbi:MAG: folylpolyglutamate synthase/dihydrofolate synthase family protein [Verrucomicrobiota bacterium]|nr:folylpolyglutamate synthase/dihydrofolate synthase family protein [Verrucomicrobiota bacterium]